MSFFYDMRARSVLPVRTGSLPYLGCSVNNGLGTLYMPIPTKTKRHEHIRLFLT